MSRKDKRDKNPMPGSAPSAGEPTSREHSLHDDIILGNRVVQVSGDVHGIVSTGNNSFNIQQNASVALPSSAFKPMADIAAPPQLRHLPHQAGLFVGRGEILARMKEEFAADQSPIVVQALHGLGGIGKSTLAARYAARSDLNPIWWVNADTSTNISAGLADLCIALQPALSTVLPVEVLQGQAIQWLASHTGWLLVLDNVENPADIQQLIASAPTGRFLITSRRAVGWHGIARPIGLDVLDEGEAVDMLARIIANFDQSRLSGAEDLCDQLGYLPLAIEQAGSYIAETGATPQEYMRLLADAPAVMLAETAGGRDPERTIARVWSVTLDRLAGESFAGDLLRVLAWFAAQQIPRSLLTRLGSAVGLHRATGRLASYSMITVSDDMLAVHRLVQQVARTPASDDDPHRAGHQIDEARGRAAALLYATMPTGQPWAHPETWPQIRELLPHIDAFTTHSPPADDTKWVGDLLNRAAMFLQDQGSLDKSISYFQRAYDVAERLLGASDRSTLAARNNLAGGYRKAGDHGRAILLLEQSLADEQQTLGADDPAVVTTRAKLASAYEETGDRDRAITMLRQSLADLERLLGPDHIDTLITRSDLAWALKNAQDSAQAISLFEKNLADAERILGADHSLTLTARGSLAMAYRDAGNHKTAILLFEKTLVDMERVLGVDDLHTLTTRTNLARLLQAAGNLEQAIPLFEQTAAGRKRALGVGNEATLASQVHLAAAHQQVGHWQKAAQLFEEILPDMERTKGVGNPMTITIREALAKARLLAQYRKG